MGAETLLIDPSWTNFGEMLIKIHICHSNAIENVFLNMSAIPLYFITVTS